MIMFNRNVPGERFTNLHRPPFAIAVKTAFPGLRGVKKQQPKRNGELGQIGHCLSLVRNARDMSRLRI